jgi:hypothetical protein
VLPKKNSKTSSMPGMSLRSSGSNFLRPQNELEHHLNRCC